MSGSFSPICQALTDIEFSFEECEFTRWHLKSRAISLACYTLVSSEQWHALPFLSHPEDARLLLNLNLCAWYIAISKMLLNSFLHSASFRYPDIIRLAGIGLDPINNRFILWKFGCTGLVIVNSFLCHILPPYA